MRLFSLLRNKILYYFSHRVHIAPLVVFRILFGLVMFGSMIRFMLKGWVHELYVMPKIYFPFYGFEWIKPLGEFGMYGIFIVLMLSAFMIMTGLFYRFATIIFFLGFSYVELIDKSNYLNHYYFVSLISFLLIFIPTHRYFSLDVLRNPRIRITEIPGWMIGIFKLQLLLVYFFAGIAKINYDWLIRAMPLKIWLPAKAHLPFIGWIFDYKWTAWLFSWSGMLYDIFIPFLLLIKRTRIIAFLFVVLFHILTALLFPIGMFPYIMILSTLIFFSEEFHKKIIRLISKILSTNHIQNASDQLLTLNPLRKKVFFSFLCLYFLLQIGIPFRHLLYPGNLFWTEQGYRFSWRVMLMEKAGTAFFYVREPETGRESEIINAEYLTKNQEKMMATQPDMLLQFAHFIKEEYEKKGLMNPEVRVESYVSLNGRGSTLFIDPSIDLGKEKNSLACKTWILPFND